MRLLPTTLSGRILLLVVSAVLLSEAATFAVLGYFRDRLVEQRVAERVVSYARVMQSALAAMSTKERRRFSSRAFETEGLRVVSDADARFPAREEDSASRANMMSRIRGELGGDTQVHHFPASGELPRELWVSFPVAGETWWLALLSGRLDMPLPWALLGVLAAVVGAVMVFGAGFVRSIVRPLRDLEEATGALGAGRPHPVVPSGPEETRLLAARFNAMLEQLGTNEQEQRVMLAGLPHDLRAPLARLRLRLAMLDEESRRGIQRDADDIEHIADQFIAYLRGADRSLERREQLPLTELVADRAARYRRLGCDVIASGDADIMVCADAEAMGRLLDNLIDNALRYGAPPVELDVCAASDEVILSVSDHGAGIESKQLEQALQPFTRLDAARSGGGNCGLGLAIVERIARVHGGSMRLATREGGGLVVEVRLKTGRMQDAPEPAVAAAMPHVDGVLKGGSAVHEL